MTLLDDLISKGLIPVDNDYHFFNGKSLATFDTTDLIREVVYVQSPLDTDQDGQLDLIKVNIIRPKTSHQLPTMMTASLITKEQMSLLTIKNFTKWKVI